MNKFVTNSKYQGLIVSETPKTYNIIWFKLKDPVDIKNGEIYIKERPFVTSAILKKSAKIISEKELTIPTKYIGINMAQVQATHWTAGSFRPMLNLNNGKKGIIDSGHFYTSIDSRLLVYY